MNDSRAIDRESRRQIEELLENILVEAGAGSGKTQMLAERMAAGVAAGLRGRTHGGRDVHAEGRVGAGAASTSRSRESWSGRAPSRRASPRTCAYRPVAVGAVESGALLRWNHSLVLRAALERPVESGVSPGFTELDEVQDLELRQRSWRDFITSARAAGDSDMIELLQADIRRRIWTRRSGGSARTRTWSFRRGRRVPGSKPAWKALDAFWQGSRNTCPRRSTRTPAAGFSKPSTRFVDSCVCRGGERPAVVASLLATWDRESKIIQNRWADSRAGRASGCADRNPAWRLPHECRRAVSRAMASVCVSARDRPADSRFGRVRAPPPELSQLR